MNPYLIAILVIAGLVLLVIELRMPKWRTIAGGLAINILAAALVLIIQLVYAENWPVIPVLIGGSSAIILMLPFIIFQQRRQRAEFDNAIKQAQSKQEQLEQSIAEKDAALEETRAKASRILAGSGLSIYARNYVEDFQRVTGREFGEYVRSFVTNSRPGSIFKILGIDWTELFGEAISATSERYFRLLSDPKTQFRVILLDPRTPVGLEKRISEYNLIVDGKPRYVKNHPDRVYGKIIGATKMLVDYHHRLPTQFQYKFIKELPTAAFITNGEQIVFYPYTRSHKGWDSPVFVGNKVPDGIYEFFDEYFDFLWQNPNVGSLKVASAWTERKRELASSLAEFEQLLVTGCNGPHHENCPKL